MTSTSLTYILLLGLIIIIVISVLIPYNKVSETYINQQASSALVNSENTQATITANSISSESQQASSALVNSENTQATTSYLIPTPIPANATSSESQQASSVQVTIPTPIPTPIPANAISSENQEQQKNYSSCLSQLQDTNSLLTNCTNDNKALQAKINTTQQDATNNKVGWMKCQSDSQGMQTQSDKLNASYNSLQGQMNQVNQTSLSGTNQVAITQESISDCQSQMSAMNGSFITSQEHYNGLVQKYKDLQDSYDNLANQFYVKCFRYNQTLNPVK